MLKRFKKNNPPKASRASRNPRRADRGNPPVFSYYSSRRSPGEPSLSRHEAPSAKYRRPLVYIPSFLAGLVILACLFFAATLDSHSPRIILLGSPESQLLAQPDQDYQATVTHLINQRLSNRSKLMIDTNKLAKDFMAQHPEVESATIGIPLISRRPVVRLALSRAVLLMRGSSSQDYVIDERGYVVGLADGLPSSQRNKLLLITDEIQLDVELGQAVLPARTVEFIDHIRLQLSAKDMSVERIRLPAVANELHVDIKDLDYYVKFNIQDDARQQAGAFLAIHDRALREGGNSLPREYVDVRIEGRAYYR